MKTHNYDIDLMLPMQTDKEILFNEAQLKIDSFCNNVVYGFIDRVPDDPVVGRKYILSSNQDEGDIYYCADLSKGWQILKPKINMMVFLYEENSFFIFEDGNKWRKVTL